MRLTAKRHDERPVQPDRPRKSVGAEDTFSVDLFDLETARAEISPLAAKVWRHREGKQLQGRTVTLKVKYADFQIITRSRTAATPIKTADDLETVARALLDPLFPAAKGVRLLGVTLSSFVEDEGSEPDQLALQI